MIENSDPEIFAKTLDRKVAERELDPNVEDPVDAREIYDLIKDLKDPEHRSLTLEQLRVVRESEIKVDLENKVISVGFVPTIRHCSMAPLIGLSLIVKLLRTLPEHMKVDVRIVEASHEAHDEYNKQLGDKERVAAALENKSLLAVINACIADEEHFSWRS